MTLERVREAQARPVAWDVIQEITRIARENGLIVASHDDDTLDKIGLMHELGVTMSEFPVSLEAAQAARQRGMAVVMGAPNAFRGISTSGNLSAREAVRAGLVDLLAADYHPGLLLHAAYALASEGLLSLHEAIALISTNVARALGLKDRGAIQVNQLADIALVDERNPRPRVRGTLRRGRAIYLDRAILS
jgi:alpha-D-ribose 1-methylphosphonate 5-triphosphate diphosphatase